MECLSDLRNHLTQPCLPITVLFVITAVFIISRDTADFTQYGSILLHIKQPLNDKTLPEAEPVLNSSNLSTVQRHQLTGNNTVTESELLFQYTFKQGKTTIVGQKFNVPARVLKVLGFPIQSKDFVTLTQEIVRDFVFLTAASEDHFPESLDCIALIQKYQPHRKIIFYDLGISKGQKIIVNKLCNVEVRVLRNITHLPRFVYNPKVYSWKPVVIFETLKEYSGVFWIDSSVRLNEHGQWEALYREILSQAKEVVLFLDNTAFHSVFAATHASMYKYLPSNIDALRRPGMLGSGTMLFYRTKETCENIVYWFTLCGLDNKCMKPPGSQIVCKFTHDMRDLKCHRYDQSAINILLHNHYSFQWERFVSNRKLLTIRRGANSQYYYKVCSS